MTTLTDFVRASLVVFAATVTIDGVGAAQSGSVDRSPETDSSVVLSGVYSATARESIFSPCDVPGIGSGWWLRFNDPADAAFLKHQYSPGGWSTLTHFIRVRGRVSGPGRYGLGFQTRELVVDSVLDVKDVPQPCASYEELPHPWTAVIGPGARIVGTAITDYRVLLAVADLEGFVTIWNTATGTRLREFPIAEAGHWAFMAAPHAVQSGRQASRRCGRGRNAPCLESTRRTAAVDLS